MNEERRDNGNGWDSRGCVDVFGGRRDWHVINMMQSVYEQENISTEWRDSLIVPIIIEKEE